MNATIICPQLIDPTVDYLAYMLLCRMRMGANMHTGIKLARKLVADRCNKPVLLVVCTDAFGAEVGLALEGLRELATASGVPVVHALSRRCLAEACGARHTLTVVSLMSIPDEWCKQLLLALMDKASDAYKNYFLLITAPHLVAPTSPVSICEVGDPAMPFALSLAGLSLGA